MLLRAASGRLPDLQSVEHAACSARNSSPLSCDFVARPSASLRSSKPRNHHASTNVPGAGREFQTARLTPLHRCILQPLPHPSPVPKGLDWGTSLARPLLVRRSNRAPKEVRVDVGSLLRWFDDSRIFRLRPLHPSPKEEVDHV